MKDAPQPHAASSAVTLIEPVSPRLLPDLRELWRFRELFLSLAQRDIKLRYKGTVFGFAWAVFQPLLQLSVLSVVFGFFARVPTGETPYAVVAFCGLVPHLFFSRAVTEGANSLLVNSALIKKVYFPRIMAPAAALVAAAIDLVISTAFLVGLMLFYGLAPRPGLAALPLFILLTFALALGASIWLSALTVQYRDVAMALPVVLQLLLFISPVIYPASLVPASWLWLYGLNPFVGIIEGIRWAVIGHSALTPALLVSPLVLTAALLAGGAIHFKRFERIAPDVM